jgi:Fe2+ or Zn2+ uptake regulation protein
VHASVEARLRLAEQRYTSGRRRLVDLLARAEHPLAIQEISRALPDLPRSTAYRNLVDLESSGLVRRVGSGDGFARFELDEELTEHHHHLVCLQCGRVIDVVVPPRLEQNVTRAVADVSTAHGFLARDHRLDVTGTCADCRRGDRPRRRAAE